MNIKEFEQASDEDLRRSANECFIKASLSANAEFNADQLTRAKFYMDEIDRRDDAFRSKRDFWLEIAIITLIVTEIGLSTYGIKLAVKEDRAETAVMNQQNGILSNLQESTKTTASLLEQQFDLEYTLAINVEYTGSDSLAVFNNSKSPVSLAGVTVGNMAPRIKGGRPMVIADHNMLPIQFQDYNPKLRDKIFTDAEFTFPVKLYLLSGQGKEFIWDGQLTRGKASGNLNGSPAGRLVARQWSQAIKILPTPSNNP